MDNRSSGEAGASEQSDYRDGTDLSGTWQFVTDPDGVGRDEAWYEPQVDWPDGAHEVDVPHAWQELDAYREYTGAAWYRRTVEHDGADGYRAVLSFGAVDYEATVWVNGERVGSNRGGYLPFSFDVTDALRTGENAVVVEVVDPDDISEIPHGKQGAPWYQRVSGIWQDVTLSVVPRTRVTDVRVTPDLEADAAHVEVTVTAGSGDATGATGDGATPASDRLDGLTATVAVSDDGEPVGDATVEVVEGEDDRRDEDDGRNGTATATVSVPDADYWTPESPSLYDVTVELSRDGDVLDRHGDYFGMRSVESRDGRLFLNGEPFTMRGALDQGYYPGTLYRPFDDSLFEEEIRTAKELGFNLLRKHIKPAHPEFLELADRLGILVWEEPANPTVHTERSKREVREQIRGLIGRDYNRPSVVVWSLYNEEWGIGNPQGLDEETSLWEDETKQGYLADLYEEAKGWDPTRLVCDNSGWAHVATDVNDYHRYFVSPDRAAAWAADIDAMTSAPEDNYAATETDPAEAPLIVSEFGTWGMCDLPAIEEFYGGTPPWFDYDFFDHPIKRPAGAYERFEGTTLPAVFDDWGALATAWQEREYRSIKDVIERMRVDDGVAGYVITEFSDIEWEFNGVLDYRREEKAFHDDFARVNDDVFVSIDVADHVVRAGGTLAADVVVRNDTTDAIDDEIEWSLFDEEGTVPVTLDGFGTARVHDAIRVDVPAVDEPTTGTLEASLPAAPPNEEPITVVPSPDGNPDVAVYADTESVASALEGAGFASASTLGAADVAVLADPDAEARAYVEDGGDALIVPDEDGHVADGQFFEYRDLPEEESWNLVACLFYRDDEALAPLVDRVPGWELEGLYPYDVVADVTREDDVRVGYVEGWIANWSAAAVTRKFGEGSATAFTFRVSGAGSDQPVGVASLAALIEDVASN